MNQSICSIEDCSNLAKKRGWCRRHYDSWRRHGDPLATSYARCASCSELFKRAPGSGVPPKKCPECTPRPRSTCPACAGPLPRTTRSDGTLAPAPKYCSDDCKPRCSVDGCYAPSRKRGWCANHYAMWHKHGEIREWSYKWATDLICEYCGGPSGIVHGYRKYCSANCETFARTYPNGRPEYALCLGCSGQIDLNKRGKGGKRKRVGSRLCNRCKRSIHKHDMTVEQLAKRDGIDCSICGDPVDLGAVRPDPFRPSIDHYIPRSNGGTNDPENLRLSHLWCNQVKSDRESFTI